MRIGDLARRSGLSPDTLRYYERIGLLPRIHRDAGGQRAYDPAVLVWIEFLGRLKATGMPIREMLRYAALRAEGPATAADRRILLERHRAEVAARIADLQANLLVLDTKIAGYAGARDRRTDDDADADHVPGGEADRPA